MAMSYLALTVGFILSILTAWISYRDKKADFVKGKSSSNSFKTVFVIALLGASMTMVTNISSLQDKVQSGRRAKMLNDSLFSMNNQLIESQKLNLNLLLEQQKVSHRIVTSQDEIFNLNQDLANANNKIIDLQDSVIGNIIGTGNIPHFSIAGPYTDTFYNTLQFSITNVGKSPLRGLRAYIMDMYSGVYFNRQSGNYEIVENTDSLILYERLFNNEKEILIGDLPPKSWKSFYHARIPKPLKEIGYWVRVQWDNSSLSFDFSAKLDPEKKRISMKLDRIIDWKGKILPDTLVRFAEFNR